MIIHSYTTESGRDLIMEYINALEESEKVDGLSVLETMEKGEFNKILFKRWDKKFMKCILGNIIGFFM